MIGGPDLVRRGWNAPARHVLVGALAALPVSGGLIVAAAALWGGTSAFTPALAVALAAPLQAGLGFAAAGWLADQR